MAVTSWQIAAMLVSVAALSMLLTWAAIGYARRRQLLDLPGRRRSHRQATPRGGGIGIVVSLILAGLTCWPDPQQALCLAGAIALVGGVGWVDDHRGLAASWRLLAHAAAVALLLVAFGGDFAAHVASWSLLAIDATGALIGLGLAIAVGLWLVWSINLHNFMDGIDGILAMQAVFVFALAVVAFAHAGTGRDALASAACLAATCGFLPFNFPRARVFMGDVGSGVLGLLLGLVMLGLSLHPGLAATTGVIAGSAFIIDATCTLVSRILAGRRWYSAHREHLYQWLFRSGFSHARVVAFYMGWNMLIVVPTLLWINRAGGQGSQVPSATALFALGVFTWVCGKQWCLRHAVMETRHEAA